MQICSARRSSGQQRSCARSRNGTYLSSVGVLAPHDATTDDVNLGVIVDDGGTLASELEGDGAAARVTRGVSEVLAVRR